MSEKDILGRVIDFEGYEDWDNIDPKEFEGDKWTDEDEEEWIKQQKTWKEEDRIKEEERIKKQEEKEREKEKANRNKFRNVTKKRTRKPRTKIKKEILDQGAQPLI